MPRVKKSIKKKIKKLKKIKKILPRSVRIRKLISKPKRAKRKKNFVQESFQDLRDVVARLPEMPLPGAPVDLPKDLPDLNPIIEPELLPRVIPVFKSASSETVRAKPDSVRGRIGMWAAVAITFVVIAGVWVNMLGGTISLPASGINLDEDIQALKNEFESAAENIKGVLGDMDARLETARAEEGAKPGNAVLKAVGARVIFEASRSASGTVNSAP